MHTTVSFQEVHLQNLLAASSSINQVTQKQLTVSYYFSQDYCTSEPSPQNYGAKYLKVPEEREYQKLSGQKNYQGRALLTLLQYHLDIEYYPQVDFLSTIL